MAQLFPSSANTIARASIVGAALLGGVVFATGQAVLRGPFTTEQYLVRNQPVPFSHEHHVRGLGLDCRYCHTSVEESYYAGMPPTYTCMSCHSQVWVNAQMLAPVRQSLAEDKPIVWNRVHDVPDYAYFNHSIHVKKGVGCAECHGEVDNMPLMYKTAPMSMEWCLNCHRNPELFLRPRTEVYNLAWKAADVTNPDTGLPYDQLTLGRKLKDEYQVRETSVLTNCSICHR